MDTSSGKRSQVQRALWIYVLIVIGVTGLSYGYYSVRHFFYTRPLFAKDDQFRDLTNYIGKVAHLRNGSAALGSGQPVFNYPAPAAFVYKALIYTVPSHPVRTYLIFFGFCVLCFAVAGWLALRNSKGGFNARIAILVTALLGYPSWYVADRGNIEGVVWIFAAAGLCFFLTSRYRAAAVFLGLAAAIKPFCILFFLLLLRYRKYKEAALGFGTVALLILSALVYVGPNPWKAYQNLKPGVSLYIHRYVTTLAPVDEARFNHSLLDGMKSAALITEMGSIRSRIAVEQVPRLIARPGGWHPVQVLAHLYFFVAIIGLGLLVVFFYKMPLLNQLIAISAAVTLIPPAAGDYSLLHLYIPFGAFIIFLIKDVASGKVAFPYRSMATLCVIYGLLFAPLTFLAIFAGDAKLLLLLALLVVTAKTPMNSSYFGKHSLVDSNHEPSAWIEYSRC